MKVYVYWPVLAGLFCMSAMAADLDRSGVEQRLAQADKSHPADLRRKDLTDLDLSNLDLSLIHISEPTRPY